MATTTIRIIFFISISSLDFFCLCSPPPVLPNPAKSVGQGGVGSGAAKVVFFCMAHEEVSCFKFQVSGGAPKKSMSKFKASWRLCGSFLTAKTRRIYFFTTLQLLTVPLTKRTFSRYAPSLRPAMSRMQRGPSHCRVSSSLPKVS